MENSLLKNRLSCWLIWDKMQEFSGAVFEMAWASFTSPAKAFRMSRVEAYTNQSKIHPTQKPTRLYEWILHNYAKPNVMRHLLDAPKHNPLPFFL